MLNTCITFPKIVYESPEHKKQVLFRAIKLLKRYKAQTLSLGRGFNMTCVSHVSQKDEAQTHQQFVTF